MTRRRRQVLLLAGLACGVAALCLLPSDGDGARAPHAEALPSASDKPFGPVMVLLVPGQPGTQGQAVHASLRPVRTLEAVTWHWEFAGGARLLHGPSTGSANPGAGILSELDALLLAPPGGAPGHATLVVEARFDGGGGWGPEMTVQSATISWGEQPDSPVPLVAGIDAETGTLTRFAVLPSTHVPGR
jgi:hypothetical protein